MEMIAASPGRHVDIHQAAKVMNVKKRRIYDVTNVLQGIGLTKKTAKNKIVWISGNIEDLFLFNDTKPQPHAASPQIQPQAEVHLRAQVVVNPSMPPMGQQTNTQAQGSSTISEKSNNPDQAVIEPMDQIVTKTVQELEEKSLKS